MTKAKSVHYCKKLYYGQYKFFWTKLNFKKIKTFIISLYFSKKMQKYNKVKNEKAIIFNRYVFYFVNINFLLFNTVV